MQGSLLRKGRVWTSLHGVHGAGDERHRNGYIAEGGDEKPPAVAVSTSYMSGDSMGSPARDNKPMDTKEALRIVSSHYKTRKASFLIWQHCSAGSVRHCCALQCQVPPIC